jgi:hypothetical protein
MKTIKLTADGVIKEFGPAHAQAILRHQEKTKCVSCWEIVDKDKYEFTKGELHAVKRDKKSTGDKAEPVGNTASKDPTE